ncbi:hypothetical protein [Brevundimonas lenta]|uniref:DUF2946 domain-containing protein n=1 Tax=Brevundimonas lenta TaxID=424796 RepID=A0A7W6JE01_9CAUL|nr:hypothetical protein [Brevundimonas lenta]MBB4083393.1 hypothetical protein [Brevundimonas lenta]
MTALRTFILLLGALAVLILGALATPGSAEASAPPCHEMSHGQPADEAPSSPDKPVKPMGCCVACVATVAPEPPMRAALALPAPPRSAALPPMPVGQTLSPEPGPPRLLIA